MTVEEVMLVDPWDDSHRNTLYSPTPASSHVGHYGESSIEASKRTLDWCTVETRPERSACVVVLT